MLKKVFSLVMCLVMIFSTLTFVNTTASAEISSISVGDCITLGSYNGKSIEWQCVLIDDNGPLMLATDVICEKEYDAAGDSAEYHSDSWGNSVRRREGSNNWQDSNIRQWLNTSGIVEYSHCPPSYKDEAGFLSNFSSAELSYVKNVTHKVTVVRYDAQNRDGYCDGGSSDNFNSNPIPKDLNINNYYHKSLNDSFMLLDINQVKDIYHSNPDYLKCSTRYFVAAIGGNNYACFDNTPTFDPNTTSLTYYYTAKNLFGIRPAFYLDVDSYSDQYNDEIVKMVSKYTSDGSDADFFTYVANNTALTGSQKVQMMADYFENYGITDINEGVNYIRDNLAHRNAYNFLINDDIYTANVFTDWLNNTAKGKAARAVLIADGLIFNNEVGDWVFGEDPPDVKKYKELLLDFMRFTSDECEYATNVKQVNEIVKNGKDLLSSAEKTVLSNEMKNVKSLVGSKALLNEALKMVDSNAKNSNKDVEIEFKSTTFAKGMGMANLGASIIVKGIESVRAFTTFNAKLETIDMFSSFLEDVANANGSLPTALRVAASDLLNEVEQGYLAPLETTIHNMWEIATSATTFAMALDLKEEFISYFVSEGAAKAFCSGLAAFELSAWVINALFDIGNLTEKVSYTEGYAYLSSFYKNKLIIDKSTFLSNQSSENAWQFYRDYTLLWGLRYNGEQAYLTMNTFKGASKAVANIMNKNGFEIKKAYVESNCNNLYNNCRFLLPENITVPESYSFAKKAVVKCPVDVIVSTSSGKTVATLKDGAESTIENEHGKFMVVYSAYEDEYIKVLYFANDNNYKISTVGVDKGLVQYSTIVKPADSEEAKILTIDNLTVDKGSQLLTNTSNQTYSLDYDNDGSVDKTGNLNDTSDDVDVPESITLSTKNVELNKFSSHCLNVEVLPSTSTDKRLEWVSLDDSIATVKEGKITAVSEGETQILVHVDGNPDVCETINVIVTPPTASSLAELLTVDMLSGASMRLNDPTGLRFYTKVNTDMIQKIRDAGATVKMGTLIAPIDLIETEELTFDLDESKYVDVVYDSTQYYTEGDFTGIVGSIVNIKDKNAARNFVARGYITVEYEGESKTIYADYANNNINDNKRSIGYVSSRIKNDVDYYDTLMDFQKEIVDKYVQLYKQIALDPFGYDIWQ